MGRNLYKNVLGFFFSDPPPTDSLTDSEDDSSGEVEVEKSRRNRVERVHDITESKRKKKRSSEIENEEVDSEGKSVLKIQNGHNFK